MIPQLSAVANNNSGKSFRNSLDKLSAVTYSINRGGEWSPRTRGTVMFSAIMFSVSAVALFAIGMAPIGWAMATAASVAWAVALDDDGRPR